MQYTSYFVLFIIFSSAAHSADMIDPQYKVSPMKPNISDDKGRICRTDSAYNGRHRECHTGGHNGPPPVGWTCSCKVGFGSNEVTLPGHIVEKD